MFKISGDLSFLELEAREKTAGKALRFGVDFLDDAFEGILPDDLVLLGAPSGFGKTQLCCNIALANLEDGKRVHYIALEAAQFEIERRLKFPFLRDRFYSDPDRPRLPKPLTYQTWLNGSLKEFLRPYEQDVGEFYKAAFQGLSTLYKTKKFGLSEFLQSIALCAEETDLILIDHVHYFDFEDDNENRAIKQIAKTVREVAIQEQKPIVLVAHLRKRDKQNEDLVAGLDEFHGSSDLYKIATKVITMASGKPTTDGKFETFFRAPKNRNDGSPSRFLAREIFDPRKGSYEKNKYQLGWAEQKRSKGFSPLDRNSYPVWSRFHPSHEHHVPQKPA